MEADRKPSLRPKRKPLSDCTNIIPTTRKNPPLSSSSKIPISQTLIKHAKPSNFINNNLNPQISSSPKSYTSTGSNNSPNSFTIPSIPRSPDPPAPPTPLSDAGNPSQRHDGATRKDKGKMVADTPIIQLSASLTSKPLQISSSTDPGHCSRSDIQVIHSQNLQTQTVKDTEKITSDASCVSKYLHMSPSVSSGSFSEAPAINSQKLHEEKRKDKGKTVLETPDIEAFEPSTPHAPLVSPTASGTRDRPVTVYNQRRARQGNKHAAGNMNVLFSCPPPDQRIKRKGSVLGYDRGKNKSGSHTDPIPVHKKKRSRDKYGGGAMHVMPKEEVEKLRAYYADIDSFELPEEVASESEVE